MSAPTHHVTAQPYPNRPLRIIVASGVGAGPDIAARVSANELGLQLRQQVVFDNRPGASGIIGYEMLARAMPDGYTFGYIGSAFASIPSAYSKLPFDSARDFQPINNRPRQPPCRRHTGKICRAPAARNREMGGRDECGGDQAAMKIEKTHLSRREKGFSTLSHRERGRG